MISPNSNIFKSEVFFKILFILILLIFVFTRKFSKSLSDLLKYLSNKIFDELNIF